MKVKNIMFSGFMAAVLAGACGAADAATVLASKDFVTEKLALKQDNLTAGTGISIENNVVASTYSDAEIKADIQALEETVGATAELGGKTIVEYIDAKTEGVNSTEAVSQLQSKVNAVEGKLADLPADTTVAEAIADAVSDKVTTSGLSTTLEDYTTGAEHTALAGRVTANEGAITGLQNTKADKTALDGNVTTGTLTEYQGTVSTALDGKASTGDVTALDGRVTAAEGKISTAEGEIDTLQSEMDAVEAKALANETAISNLDSTYAKDSDVETAIANLSQEGGAIATLTGTVAGIEADVEGIETELAGVKATADAAQTAQQVKDTVESYGYQTAGQVNTAIEGKGYATKTYVDGQDATTLQSAKDSAAALYQVKGKYMVDPEAKGTYLVTRAEDGTISYSAVQVVGPNDAIVLQ